MTFFKHDGCHMWHMNCLSFRSTWVHYWFLMGLVFKYLVFYTIFCRSLFVFLSFFFWSLCCLSFDHCVVCLLIIVLSVLLWITASDCSLWYPSLFLTFAVCKVNSYTTRQLQNSSGFNTCQSNVSLWYK